MSSVGQGRGRTAGARYTHCTRLLAFSYMRRRPLRAVLAVVTIAAAVSVPGAVLIQIESYNSSFSGSTGELAEAAPLRVDSVQSHGGLPADLVEDLDEVDGVAAVVPVVQAVTAVSAGSAEPGAPSALAGDDTFVLALGVDCTVEALVGPFGCSSSRWEAEGPPAAPLFGSGLAELAARPGAVVRTSTEDVPLAGAQQLPALDAVMDGRALVFPLVQAQGLFGRGSTVDAAYVRPAPNADLDDVRAALTGVVGDRATVADTSAPPPEAAQSLRVVRPLLLIAVLAVVVGGLMVFSLMRLAYQDRRSAYATAWALGCRPRLVVAATATEAALLGSVGGVLGLAGSVLLARPLVASLSSQTEVFTGIPVTEQVGAVAVVVTIGLGAVIGVMAALVSSWWLAQDFLPSLLPGRATADHQPAGAPTRWILGFLGLAALGLLAAAQAGRRGGISVWQQPVGLGGLTATFVGLVGASAMLVPVALGFVARRLAHRPGLVPLAVVDAARNSRRAVAVSLTVTSAVTLGVILAGVETAIREGSADFVATYQGERLLVTKFEPMPPDFASLSSARFEPEVAARLRSLPSVAAVDESHRMFLRTDDPTNVAVSADGGELPVYPVVDGTVPDGGELPPGQAIVGTGLARARGLRAGSTLSVPTPSGPQELRIAAVWQENSAVGDSLTVSVADHQRLWGDLPPLFLAVRPASGVGLEQLKADVSDLLGPEVHVLTPADYFEVVEGRLVGMLAPFQRLEQTWLIVVALATFVLLLLFGLQRLRQQAIMQSVGMRPSQLVRVSCASAAVIGLFGAAAGAISGVIAMQAARWNGLFFVGTIPPFRWPGLSLLVAVGLATAAVAAGSIVPAVATVRTDIAARLRYE